jgi:hypothetical protein
MKKITFLLFTMVYTLSHAQQKTTGLVNLLSNTTATLLLNNATSTATLTLSGPNDRWFALQFGSFNDGDGMNTGEDLVYWNGVTLVDAFHNGQFQAPSVDATNNWTLVASLADTPTAGLRTVVFTRPFVTGDSNDYQFNFADTSIDFAFARRSSAGFTMNNHGSTNRGYAIDRPYTTLGVEDFSLTASQVYPNPSKGDFTVKTNTSLNEINIYSQVGSFVKTVKVELENDQTEVNVTGLQTGIYLIELVNDSEKTWKKIIVE